MLTALILSLLVGCDDPTANAPVAEVTAPVAEPATPEPPATPATAGATLKGDNTTGSIVFVGGKITGSHSGGFNTFSASGTVADGQLTAIEGTIDMASTHADAEKLTGHLKSPDFFSIEEFTTSTFKSSSIAAVTTGGHTVTGILNFHGVEKQISFPATITVADGSASLKAEFSLNRKDFGVVYPGKPDDLIKDDVLVTLDFNLKG